MTPRSSIILKNADDGAGVIDLDYRDNLKVVIMNQSTDTQLQIELADWIAQFIMTGFETPKLVEVVEVDAIDRGFGGFCSTGQ